MMAKMKYVLMWKLQETYSKDLDETKNWDIATLHEKST